MMPRRQRSMKKPYDYLIPLCCAVLVLALSLVFSLQALTRDSLDYTLPFVRYGGTFRYPDLRIGNFRLSFYWIMMILGTAGMSILLTAGRKDSGIGALKTVITGILLAVFGFIGAKLLYILENFRSVLKNGPDLAGVSFFGTVFFMPAAIPLIALMLRIPRKGFTDFCTPAGLLMLSFIRLGCFMRGCCQGIAVWYGNRPWIVPVQLFECALDLGLLAVLMLPGVKARFRGVLYCLFMGGYGLIRFGLEFLRDTDKTHFGFSNGQLFSTAAVLISAVILFLYFRKQAASGAEKV